MLIFRGVPHSSDIRVALTIGNFDGLHLGHQAMLARLKEAACRLGVPAAVMTFEPHPREFFTPEQAPARLTSLREKLELFASHGVDRVYLFRFNRPFSQVTAQDFVEKILYRGLHPEWILVGDDFRFGAKRSGDFSLLVEEGKKLGFEVESMDSVMAAGIRVSSTAVRDALGAGRIELAATLLGRPYSISGRVVHGDKLGRDIGFPTANIQMKHNRPPVSGIFAVELNGLDGTLPGVASLGVRPTVKRDGVATLEVHLFDFDRNIYGEHVRVDFLHKLREEEKFESMEMLIAQIGRDVENAKSYFELKTQK
jgi:riboflavin kinase/FMN adenylyltransferase